MLHLLPILLAFSVSLAHAQDTPSTLKGPSSIKDIAFSPDGATLAGTGDNEVWLWEMPSGRHLYTLNAIGADNLAFSPDGATLAVGSLTGPVFLWNIGAGPPDTYNKLEYPNREVGASIAFSPDGKTIARGSYGRRGMLLLWKFGQNEPEILIDGDACFSVAFSPDGRWLAGGFVGAIGLFDVSGQSASWGRETSFVRLLGDRGNDAHTAEDMAFSPDSKLLASTAGHTVRVWDSEYQWLSITLEKHKDDVTSVAFSPDGELLASGSHDQTVRLWDAGTGRLQTTRLGRISKITSVAFSPDGKILAGGLADGTIRLWVDVQVSDN